MYVQEWQLRQFIAKQDGTDFVEVEKVVSGAGIFNTYKFLAQRACSGDDCESSNKSSAASPAFDVDLDEQIRQSPLPAAVISQHARPRRRAATASATTTTFAATTTAAEGREGRQQEDDDDDEGPGDGQIPANALCARAIDLFIQALGAECGNLAVR